VIVSWYGCDFPSGNLVTELPGLTAQGPLSRRLCAYSSCTLQLDLSAQTPDWVAATQGGRAMLVATVDDLPMWAGIVLPRSRGSAATASLTATTAESYLERRYVTDMTLSGDLSDIAAALLNPVTSTVPCIEVETAPTGLTDRRVYTDASDKTIGSALTDLAALDGGPEYTIDPRWRPDRSGFELALRIAPRIGSATATPTVWDYPGPVIDYEQQEDYSDGKGATDLLATGSGDGTTRVTSAHRISSLTGQGWPIYEYRWSPDPSALSASTLDSYTAAALPLMETGASAWTMTASAATAPQLGVDWTLGDTVRLLVKAGTSPGHPDGADVTARAWAWELDTTMQTVSPILVEDA
jgi:hypothetical protein